jgi:hypothetical protein
MQLISVQEIEKRCEYNSRETWGAVRKLIKENFSDRSELVNTVIRKMQWFYSQTGQIDDILGFYHAETSALVNDGESKFYMHG